jgi:hypothetical protein
MPAIQGLKMIFDHDEEEELELQAFDGMGPSRGNAPSMNVIEMRRDQPEFIDSSSSEGEDDNEENIRTDILKFKKK